MAAARHKLLERQVRRLLDDAGGPLDRDALGPFLDAVDAAYRQADDDRGLLERSLELTSRELLERNERLREELEQRRAVEESLRRSLVRLDAAQRVARLGYWEVDVATGAVFWSDQTYRVFGFEPGAVVPTIGLFAGVTSEGTLDRVHETIRATRGAETPEMLFPVRWPTGEERSVRAVGEVVRDAAGYVVQVHGICLDVTEEEERRQALVHAKERAEDMLRLKTAFLNNMSHELRTPLTGILGYAELLAEECVPEHRDFVTAIVRGGRRLLDTLNSVLDLAQPESGTYHLEPERVDVVAEAAEALAILQPLAVQKQIELDLQAEAAAVYACVDRPALFRVLNNVVGNAVKFTERGGVTVSVRSAPEAGRVRLSVRDTGPGIDAAFLPRLFEEFRQASTGYERAHEGNGLGLTITKRLVDLMRGEILVESVVGEGTTFDVLLPAASGGAVADVDIAAAGWGARLSAVGA